MENVLEVATPEESGYKTRRAAMLMGGAALAGLALSRRATAQTTTAPSATTILEVLNFALNLEYLEAQFYAYATTGKAYTGTTSGMGTTGTVTIKSGNPMVPFVTPGLQDFAMELAQDEANHVNFLQTNINMASAGQAVAMPNIDLLNSFNTLAKVAGISQNGFDPFASEENFLLGAFIFEDVGVTAYQGAAPMLMGSPYLDPALGIHGVEAYHAGSIRQRIFLRGSAEAAISMQIANTRAMLSAAVAPSGAMEPDDIGVETTTVNGANVSTLVDTGIANGMLSNNAMTYARNTSQVLNIVYGGGPAGTGGLFFPNGMNGTIR